MKTLDRIIRIGIVDDIRSKLLTKLIKKHCFDGVIDYLFSTQGMIQTRIVRQVQYRLFRFKWVYSVYVV